MLAPCHVIRACRWQAYFAQLWHVGRIFYTSALEDGKSPISSTTCPAKDANVFARDEEGKPGEVPVATLTALTLDGVHRVVRDYVDFACNAFRQDSAR